MNRTIEAGDYVQVMLGYESEVHKIYWIDDSETSIKSSTFDGKM